MALPDWSIMIHLSHLRDRWLLLHFLKCTLAFAKLSPVSTVQITLLALCSQEDVFTL